LSAFEISSISEKGSIVTQTIKDESLSCELQYAVKLIVMSRPADQVFTFSDKFFDLLLWQLPSRSAKLWVSDESLLFHFPRGVSHSFNDVDIFEGSVLGKQLAEFSPNVIRTILDRAILESI